VPLVHVRMVNREGRPHPEVNHVADALEVGDNGLPPLDVCRHVHNVGAKFVLCARGGG
jgi:hypothetical protein